MIDTNDTLADGLSRSVFTLADYYADCDFTCVSNGDFNLFSHDTCIPIHSLSRTAHRHFSLCKSK